MSLHSVTLKLTNQDLAPLSVAAVPSVDFARLPTLPQAHAANSANGIHLQESDCPREVSAWLSP